MNNLSSLSPITIILEEHVYHLGTADVKSTAEFQRAAELLSLILSWAYYKLATSYYSEYTYIV